MSNLSAHEITDVVTEAAARNPNGWVYKIDGTFGTDATIPPEAVVGAWQVDRSGNVIGQFIANPKYRGNNWSQTQIKLKASSNKPSVE